MAESRTPRHVRRAKSARRSNAGSKRGASGRAGQGPQKGAEARPLVAGRTRLQKLLAAAGFGSRRATEQYLRDGRVSVNGRPARLGDSADPGVDVVAVDGEKLALRKPSYWMLNKPTGVVTTMSDPEHRTTVADLLPPAAAGLFPVGRLDIDTSGLVLLTNDGALTQTLLHPSSGGEKEYRVVVKGELTPAIVGRLERGIVLDDGRTRPARVESVSFDPDRGLSTLRLVLTEGRKRQIRRSMLALGRPVKQLRRVRVGPIRLGRLRRGELRPLRPGEIAALLAYAERLRSGEASASGPQAGRRRAAPPPGSKPGRAKVKGGLPEDAASRDPEPHGRKPKPRASDRAKPKPGKTSRSPRAGKTRGPRKPPPSGGRGQPRAARKGRRK